MLAREMRLYSVSSSSSWRPYMGWLTPSILMATEGWPRLQTWMGLCSRSMDCLEEKVYVSGYDNGFS
jgi:hypothetical protein